MDAYAPEETPCGSAAAGSTKLTVFVKLVGRGRYSAAGKNRLPLDRVGLLYPVEEIIDGALPDDSATSRDGQLGIR